MKKLFVLLSIIALAITSCTTGGDDLTNENTNNNENTGGNGGDNQGGDSDEEGTTPEPVFTISPTEVTNEWDDTVVMCAIECTDTKQLSVSIDEKKYEWLAFSGADEEHIFFSLNKNTTQEPRTGKAIVHDAVSNKDITVTITQKPYNKYLTVLPQSIEIVSKGGEFEFVLEKGDLGDAYINQEITPRATEEWISFEQIESNATDDGKVTIKYKATVAPNSTTESRSSTFKFTCSQFGLEAALAVTQKAYESDGEKSYLYYTSTDGKVINIENYFDAPILSNTYSNGKGTITFDGTMTKIVGFVTPKESDADRLETVTIPDNVVEIGTGAFPYYINLKKVTIGSGVKTWGQPIFYRSGDTQFEVVVNSPIGAKAFEECEITKLTCGSGVTSIGESAFEGCAHLLEADFAEGLTRIEKRAFAYTMLVKGFFPNSLEVVADEAFWGSEYMASVIFGNKVKSLGQFSFFGTQILSIICRTATPPTYGDYALYTDGDDSNIKPLSCTILVPAASVTLYKNAKGWKAHKDKITILVEE